MGGTSNPSRVVRVEAVEAHVKSLRDVGDALNSDHVAPCLDVRNGGTCMRRESESVCGIGQTRRPYTKYRADRLCASCEAYWHVQRAADLLDHLAAITRKFGEEVKP